MNMMKAFPPWIINIPSLGLPAILLLMIKVSTELLPPKAMLAFKLFTMLLESMCADDDSSKRIP